MLGCTPWPTGTRQQPVVGAGQSACVEVDQADGGRHLTGVVDQSHPGSGRDQRQRGIPALACGNHLQRCGAEGGVEGCSDGAALRREDEGVLGQDAERERPLAGWPGDGNGEGQAHRTERTGPDARRRLTRGGDAHSGATVSDGTHHFRAVPGAHIHPAAILDETGHAGGQQVAQHPRSGGEDDPLGAVPGQASPQCGGVGEVASTEGGNHGSGRGEPHAPAHTGVEPHTEVVLQLLDLRVDGRLAAVDDRCCGREPAVVCEGHKHPELVVVDGGGEHGSSIQNLDELSIDYRGSRVEDRRRWVCGPAGSRTLSLEAPMAKNLSRRLSYVLRHRPDTIGITLDDAGWTDVDALLDALRVRGRAVTRGTLERCVETNDKKRFEFSEDGGRIRARQGHSVPVELGYTPVPPPPVLFHGTVPRALESIEATGLTPRNRHHVHLSADLKTATTVGSRRGRPVILVVDSAAMASAGHRFFRTDNGVWLTNHVPPEYLRRSG